MKCHKIKSLCLSGRGSIEMEIMKNNHPDYLKKGIKDVYCIEMYVLDSNGRTIDNVIPGICADFRLRDIMRWINKIEEGK